MKTLDMNQVNDVRTDDLTTPVPRREIYEFLMAQWEGAIVLECRSETSVSETGQGNPYLMTLYANTVPFAARDFSDIQGVVRSGKIDISDRYFTLWEKPDEIFGEMNLYVVAWQNQEGRKVIGMGHYLMEVLDDGVD